MPAPLNPEVIAQIKAILKHRGTKTKPTYQEIADANNVSLRTVKSIATGKHEKDKAEMRKVTAALREEDQGYGRETVYEVMGDDITLISTDYVAMAEEPVRASDAEYLIKRFTRFPHYLEGIETRLELEAMCRAQFIKGSDIEPGTFLKVQRWIEGRLL